MLLFLFLIAAAIGCFLWMRFTFNKPVEHGAAAEIITIHPGMGPGGIVNRLADAGIVRHPGAFKIYLRIMGRSGRLKAGDYKFDSPISPLEAIGKIERGEVYVERVTIPEGLDRFEISELLAARTGKASAEQFMLLTYATELIEKIDPSANNLEGYLFPDTYQFTTMTTPEDLIKAMVERFNDVFTPELATRASQLGLSVHQVVTLASMIEEEARVPDERPRVASVFMNRLKRGMPLASDPTFIYAAKLAHDYDGNPNQPRHRRRDSRYNTYIYNGLPPGPISSPGRASLEA
ncbi:MAG TPA: endolytic transglycosylase MltG, partial [Blastocatellia bacterium]|nr:endolytic transglycosylase MltG [Blastocatellia bacterium]